MRKVQGFYLKENGILYRVEHFSLEILAPKRLDFFTATAATSQLTQASDICIATSLPPCVTQPQQLQGSGSSAVDTRNYSYDSQASFTSSMELWYEHPFIYNWWINTPTTYILLCIPLLHIIIIIMIWCAMNYVSLCIILSTMVYICYFKVSRLTISSFKENERKLIF